MHLTPQQRPGALQASLGEIHPRLFAGVVVQLRYAAGVGEGGVAGFFSRCGERSTWLAFCHARSFSGTRVFVEPDGVQFADCGIREFAENRPAARRFNVGLISPCPSESSLLLFPGMPLQTSLFQ